eukprot:11395804-Alexandrium_andersonii.AAC.1
MEEGGSVALADRVKADNVRALAKMDMEAKMCFEDFAKSVYQKYWVELRSPASAGSAGKFSDAKTISAVG